MLTGICPASTARNNRCSLFSRSRITPLYIFDPEADLSSNCAIAIAVLLQPLDIVKKINCAVLAASKIFHQAHHQAVLGVRFDDKSWYLTLSEYLVRF